MGALYSYFYGSAESDEVDPGTGLTATQKKLIQQCWTVVDRNTLDIGIDIMVTFLRQYPKYQDVFVRFRGKDLDELAKDRVFHSHCLNIMGVFSQAVQFIDDAELCTAGLHMAGERHGRRGQEWTPFELMQPIVTQTLKTRLGAKCTDQVSEALDTAITFIFKEIKHGIDEYNANKKMATTG